MKDRHQASERIFATSEPTSSEGEKIPLLTVAHLM